MTPNVCEAKHTNHLMNVGHCGPYCSRSYNMTQFIHISIWPFVLHAPRTRPQIWQRETQRQCKVRVGLLYTLLVIGNMFFLVCVVMCISICSNSVRCLMLQGHVQEAACCFCGGWWRQPVIFVIGGGGSLSFLWWVVEAAWHCWDGRWRQPVFCLLDSGGEKQVNCWRWLEHMVGRFGRCATSV